MTATIADRNALRKLAEDTYAVHTYADETDLDELEEHVGQFPTLYAKVQAYRLWEMVLEELDKRGTGTNELVSNWRICKYLDQIIELGVKS